MKKRLAILIAVVSLLGGTGFIGHKFQVNRLGEREIKKAKSAFEKGDFANAEIGFRGYLQVFPDDLEIQIEYADALLKASKSLVAQSEALGIYNKILEQPTGREDVRRKRMQLKIDMERFVSSSGQENGADVDLQILLKSSSLDPNLSSSDDQLEFQNLLSSPDGHLQFRLGQCYEKAGDDSKTLEKAKMMYEAAIKHNSPQQIEARERLATLLRDQLKKPDEAKQVIDAMVKTSPNDYRAYLARGRYHLVLAVRDPSQTSHLSDAKKDFKEAKDRATSEPEVYLALAEATAKGLKPNYDEVRQYLKAGLNNAPTSTALYQALANTERYAGSMDEAIKVLERGLKVQPDQSELRLQLTDLLIQRGDTGKLRLQVEELKRLGHSPILIQLITAHYYIMSKDFVKARQLLVTLRSVTSRITDAKFKANINVLLAQCYKELGEPEMQQSAYLLALGANPQDLTARRGWIDTLISRGDIAGAVKEYRDLAKYFPKQFPHDRLVFARLLIEYNQRRPEPQRDWNEVKELIKQLREESPEALETIILNAQFLFAQGNQAAAISEIEKARSQFPKSAEIWITQAEFMGLQRRVDDALALLVQAKQQLGDLVDLRLERAKLLASKKGEQTLKDLMDLSQDVEKFSKPDRKRLLDGLAIELFRRQDLDGASRLWTQLAEEYPSSINLRLKLLDLALQNAKKDEIEKNIKQIEGIEGSEGVQGRYCQVRYLIWQAQQAKDKDKEAIQLKARELLADLGSRRSDWSVIPLAAGDLAEQELAQGKLSGDEIRAKEESIIGFYEQAIKLGRNDPAVVRRVVQLLFKNRRISRALELLNRIPEESQLRSYLERQGEQIALENRDLQLAEQLARSDPDRWITLVSFMIDTKQLAEAEKAIEDAEAKLHPIALAQCCELMGRAHDGVGTGADAKKWNDKTRHWYEKAQAAQPQNLSIKLLLAEFLRRSGQISEAETYLEAIRKQDGSAKSAETTAWANRALALVLASGTDRTKLSKALTFFERDHQPVPAGQEGKTLADPQDLRALARVLDMQKTVTHRKRAIEILESLADKNLTTSDDRFLLAHLYEATDDWPRALEKYRELDLGTKNIRDRESANRRSVYLAQFTRGVLRHHKPGEEQDLIEAQELSDEIKQLQPDGLEPLSLQVEIYRIRKQIDRAMELIQAVANRPNLTPEALEVLAVLGEKIERFELAEQLYRRLADQSAATRKKLLWAAFLGRRDRVKDGLDKCEPLWTDVREIQPVAITCINILFGSDDHSRTPAPAQVNRVAGWFDQAIAQAQNQQRRNPWLFIGLGNLREKQRNYSEARKCYLRAVAEGDRNGISYNNLAWLAALKDGNLKEALDDANRAITLKPDQPDFLDTRGVIYLAAGQPKLALDDLKRAVAIDPSSPSKHFHLARAFLANNDKEKARQSLKTAEANGFTPSSLDALDQPSYQGFLNELGLPRPTTSPAQVNQE